MISSNSNRWSIFLRLLNVLILGIVVAACTLTSAPQQTLDLTDVPTNTVPPTRTPIGTINVPTARPTVTPLPFSGQNNNNNQPPQVSFPPTAIPPQPANTPLPISIVILSPVPGSVVAGNVQVLGAATHPQFLQYQVEYGPDPNPSNLWFPATGVVQTPITNGLLGIWNTTGVNDDTYQIRLNVTLRDGTSLSTVVNNVRVQNRQPTPIPTATTIPRPIAAFSQSATTGLAPLVVNFVNQSQGTINSYQWSFGDGGSSSEINPTHTFRQPGIYTVILTARGPGGSSNVSRQISVQSVSAPTAGFTQNRVSGESPLTVQFTDQSSGNITEREWRFGDGELSNQTSPSHTFTAVGTYNVILSITGPGGSSSVTRQITVENPSVPAPDADFTASAIEGEAPLPVNFTVNSTENINTYEWRIDDQVVSNSASFQFSFTNEGEYQVQLIAVGDGGQDIDQETISVTRPPDAPDVTISADPVSGDVPLQVQFDSNSTGGEITSYTWTFGDGNTSADAAPSHTYQQQGTYDVTLLVEGPGGTDQETTTVTAVEPIQAPVADFNAVIADETGLVVNFNNLSSGDELTYVWDFGDGTGSEEANPQHTYADYDTYSVSLTATNSAGSDTATIQIALQAPTEAVTAVAAAGPLQAAPGETIQFDSTGSSGDIATYAWDFGDGNTSTDANPTHTYQTTGTYTAQLSLTGLDDSTSSSTVEVTVAEGLQAAFVVNPPQANVGDPIAFDSSASTGTITSYTWDFGDGTGSSEANPTHIYQAAGNYTVTLTISDGVTTSQITNPVTVNQGLQAAFVVNPPQANVGDPIAFDSGASTGTITSYTWDFGDGTGSSEANPNHAYQAAGNYTVTLTISDGVTTSQITNPVTVNQGLQAAFVVNPPQANVGDPIAFDSSSTVGDQISTFSWDFGDGVTSTEPNPTHVYQAAGDYTVRLIVTDIGGGSSEATNPVSIAAVAAPPPAVEPVAAFVSQREGSRSIFTLGADQTGLQRITDTGGNAEHPDWSVNNRIVFSLDNQLFTMNHDGSDVRPVSADGGASAIQGTEPAWSPNGQQIAYSAPGQDGNPDIFIVNADGSDVRQITSEPSAEVQPDWSPDGQRLAVATNRDGQFEIYTIATDGTNPVRLTTNDADDIAPAWAPDNSRIAFASDQGENGDRELFVMNTDGSNVIRLTTTPGEDTDPEWLPNSQVLVFSSARDGDVELYFITANDLVPTRLTNSPGFDGQPAYKPN